MPSGGNIGQLALLPFCPLLFVLRLALLGPWRSRRFYLIVPFMLLKCGQTLGSCHFQSAHLSYHLLFQLFILIAQVLKLRVFPFFPTNTFSIYPLFILLVHRFAVFVLLLPLAMPCGLVQHVVAQWMVELVYGLTFLQHRKTFLVEFFVLTGEGLEVSGCLSLLIYPVEQ